MWHAVQLGSDEMTMKDALLKRVQPELTLTAIIIINNGDGNKRQTDFDFVPQNLDTPVYVVESSDDAGLTWKRYFAESKYHQDSVSSVHHCRVRRRARCSCSFAGYVRCTCTQCFNVVLHVALCGSLQ
jgi:hypothetical protein